MTIYQIQLLLLYLGYDPGRADGLAGPDTREAVKRFQQDFGGISVDGIAGEETQKALKCAVAYGSLRRDSDQTAEKGGTFWDEIQFFSPEEPYIRCPCGQCDGTLPTEKLMRLADKVRRQAGVAVIPTSTVRCGTHNAAVGGVPNSRHLRGLAMDFYIPGWSAGKTLKLVQQQPETAYAYAINETAVHMDVTE